MNTDWCFNGFTNIVASRGEALSEETSLPMNSSTTNFAHATLSIGKLTPPLCFYLSNVISVESIRATTHSNFGDFICSVKLKNPNSDSQRFPLSDSYKLGCITGEFDGEERKLQFRRGMHGEIQAWKVPCRSNRQCFQHGCYVL